MQIADQPGDFSCMDNFKFRGNTVIALMTIGLCGIG
jgi:hypothetical protein